MHGGRLERLGESVQLDVHFFDVGFSVLGPLLGLLLPD
jgi:hypothetical protein